MEKGEKILVTGANGQLGMELKELANSQVPYKFIFASKDILPLDNFEAIQKFFSDHQPQFCFNCAAFTQVDKAETCKEKAFLINAEAVSVMADCCRKYKTRLIHFSTDYVFDGTSTLPYTEEAATHPINIYGASKLAGENYALDINPETIIIRTSWVYSSYGKNFVKTMLRLMNEKKEISVVRDQVGSPTYAADLAELVMQIISSKNWQPGIYHFSNEGVISWFDFAVAIKKLINSDCIIHPISTSQYPTAAKRPLFSALDKTKIQKTFGIKLRDWRESLENCLHKIIAGI